jgi:DNA-binding SARP family transcriptional activator
MCSALESCAYRSKIVRLGIPMKHRLKLALLGQLEIRRDGEPIAELNSAKAQAPLCYLAVTRRPHFRASLAGLLWGDIPEVNARTNPRRELSSLRRALGEHLTITRQEIAFNRDAPYWLDVEVFESGATHFAEHSRTKQSGTSALHLEEIAGLQEVDTLCQPLSWPIGARQYQCRMA